MASSRLLTKILANFLSGVYLLTLVLKHATNLIHKRYRQAKKINNVILITNKILQNNETKKPERAML